MFVYVKKRKETFKILIKLTSLILGAILVWRHLFLLEHLLSFLNSFLLFILLLDLNLTEFVTGEDIKSIKYFSSLLGSLVPVIIKFNIEILGIFAFLFFLVIIILFRGKIVAGIDWINESRLQASYNNLLQKELDRDPKLLRKKIVIWGWKKLTPSSFLKTLVLLRAALEVIIYVLILATFISSVGQIYSSTIVLFILFILLALISSHELIAESNLSIGKKFDIIYKKRGLIKKEAWSSFIRSLSNLRGFLYSLLFIPSILSAIIVLSIILEFYVSLAKNFTANVQLSNPVLLIPVCFFVFVFFPILVISFIYPFYVALKLLKVNSLRVRDMSNSHEGQTRILPSPYLGLYTSILLVLTFFVGQIVPDVVLFGEITLHGILVYGLVASILIMWIRIAWLKHEGLYVLIDEKTERNLAIMMSVWAAPLYLVAFSIDMIFMIGFLMVWATFFAFLRFLSSLEFDRRDVAPPLVFFIALCLYVVLLAPEYIFVTPLITLVLFLLLLLLIPEKYLDRFAELVLRTRSVETSQNN